MGYSQSLIDKWKVQKRSGNIRDYHSWEHNSKLLDFSERTIVGGYVMKKQKT